WLVAQDVWTPVKVAGGTVPAWMTWYEEEDIEGLFRKLRRMPRLANQSVDTLVGNVMAQSAVKRLEYSFVSGPLGKDLKQFSFPELAHANPRLGTIYYSPAYVKHLLENAENIANYDGRAFSKNAPAPPRSPLTRPSLDSRASQVVTGRSPQSRTSVTSV